MLARLGSVLREHWRPAAVVAGLALAFVAGRLTGATPIAVEERVTSTTTASATTTATAAAATTATATAAGERVVTRIIYRDRLTTAADGTTTAEHEVELSGAHDITAATAGIQQATTSTTTGTETLQAVATAERETRPVLPRWRVGAMAGAQLVPLALPPALVVGVHLEARVFGPLWAGAWAMADPLAPGRNAQAGLSLTIEVP